MTGPGWLTAALAAVMLIIAAGSAARLAAWQLRGRGAEPDADTLHVLMGIAMTGMLEPRLSPVPATAWVAVFAAALPWFAWQAIRGLLRRQRGRWTCAHPAPHAVECAAMVYMLWPARAGGRGQAMAMPGMSGQATANPALAMVLALFMLGYVLWATDHLASLSRTRAGATSAVATTRLSSTGGASRRLPGAALPGSPAPPARTGAGPCPQLTPRLATCYKIAMSAAMGYMLITML